MAALENVNHYARQATLLESVSGALEWDERIYTPAGGRRVSRGAVNAAVGRSEASWPHFYPEVKQAIATPLVEPDASRFFQAVNHVQPSLIRVEADEVSYNLNRR